MAVAYQVEPGPQILLGADPQGDPVWQANRQRALACAEQDLVGSQGSSLGIAALFAGAVLWAGSILTNR